MKAIPLLSERWKTGQKNEKKTKARKMLKTKLKKYSGKSKAEGWSCEGGRQRWGCEGREQGNERKGLNLKKRQETKTNEQKRQRQRVAGNDGACM